jgi:translation initiation factor 6
LAIYQADLFGSPSIGVYSLATEKNVIIPKSIPLKKAQRFEEWLKVKLIHTTIGNSVLVGALAYANSNGIILPHFVREDEIQAIKSVFDGNICTMETKKTAYGNLVLANNRGAVVDPRLKPSDIKKVSETLCVEAVPTEIGSLPYVGSLGVATDKGALVHPLLKEEEKSVLEDVLKVPVELGTVNCGIPYVGTGLICNSHAAVVGSATTGPEMFIIAHAFDVVKEEE